MALVTTAHGSLFEHQDPDGRLVHRNLGRLVQPRHCAGADLTDRAGIPWAADNDCFQGLDRDAFCRMLDRLQRVAGTSLDRPPPVRSRCLFVAVPDAVGDAALTARMFERWSSAVRRRGLPAALVAQDGLELMPRWLGSVWPRVDALFVGGSTAWKLGPHAADLVADALGRGKHVHWGRVNTRERYRYCAAVGGHSFDGSGLARWRHTLLDRALAWTLEPPAPPPSWQLSLI